MERRVQRIALIKPSALGDIVHALPVLSALRQQYPQSHITWVVNRGFEALLTGHPHLDATLAFERGLFRQGVGRALKYSIEFANRLRRNRFDLVVDLQGLLRTGLMCAATGAPRKIGFANAREGAARFYTERVEVPDAMSIHAVDRYWRIVEHLHAGGDKQFIVSVSKFETDVVCTLFKDLPRPWVAVAVGAKWVTKRWPPTSFGVLLARMQRAFGGTVLFVGTGEDRADSLTAVQSLAGPWRDLTGTTTLPRLAAVLSLCDAMVANDTGPLHLAAALGVPCVAPYTCTKTALHGPYHQNGGVETRVACGGSYLKHCPNTFECFTELTPARLWPTLEGVLQSWARRCA